MCMAVLNIDSVEGRARGGGYVSGSPPRIQPPYVGLGTGRLVLAWPYDDADVLALGGGLRHFPTSQGFAQGVPRSVPFGIGGLSAAPAC